MIPVKLRKRSFVYQCKYCRKVYKLGDWVPISWVVEVKARMSGCKFIEDDCGCQDSDDTTSLLIISI
jgi:hypothetical protein